MPTSAAPDTTAIDDIFVVHVQSDYSCASHYRFSYDTNALFFPSEVFFPILPTGMVQRCHLPRKGIIGYHRTTFEFVTTPASIAQVLKFCSSILRTRENVLHCHGLPGILTRCLAIGAAMIIRSEQALAQRLRKIGAHGVAAGRSGNGTGRPRQRSRAAAWALHKAKRSASKRNSSS